MGRPLLRSRELRQRVDCYFSNIELDFIRPQAKEVGLPLSTFIRKAALGVRIEVLPSANAELWHELSRTAANLNQIAKHLNGGIATDIPIELLNELGELIRELRLELLGASK